MPLDNTEFFQDKSLNLVDWLRQFTKNDEERHEEFMRGFLGRMLSQETKLLNLVPYFLEAKK
jgi:hypothetical protein